MKRTIYVAKSDRTEKGCTESFNELMTYELDDAETAIERAYSHLTENERKTHEFYIEGYNVDVFDGKSAEEAYNRLLDEDEIPEPCFCELYTTHNKKIM